PFTLSLTGNYNGPGTQSDTGTVAFVGSGPQTLNQTNQFTAFLPNVLVQKPAGTLTVNQGAVSGTVTVAQGTLDGGPGGQFSTLNLTVQSGATFVADRGLQIANGGLLNLESGSTFVAPATGTGGGGNVLVAGGVAVAAGAVFTQGTPLNFVQGSNQFYQSAVDIGTVVLGSGVTVTANSLVGTLQFGGAPGGGGGGIPWLFLGPYALSLSGDFKGNPGFTNFHDNSGTVIFDGSGAEAANVGFDAYFNNLLVAKPSGALTIADALPVTGTMTVAQGQVLGDIFGTSIQAQNLALNGGSLDCSSINLTTNPGGLFSMANGAVFIAPSAPRTFNIGGSLNFSAGALVTPGQPATFQPGAGSHTLQSAVPMGDVTLLTGVTLAAGATVGNVNIQNAGFFGLGPYTLSVDGNWNDNIGQPPFIGTGTVVFAGSGDQSLTHNNSYPFPNLTVNKPSGTLSFPYQQLYVSGTTTVDQGTLDASQGLQTTGLTVNNGTVTLGGQRLAINPGGTLYVAPGAVLNQGAAGIDCYGSVDFPAGALVTGAGQIRFPGGQGLLQSAVNFGDIQVIGGSVTLSADTVVTNALVRYGWMSLGGHTLTVLGNWALQGDASTFDAGPGTLLFGGSGAQTMDPGFGTATYGTLTVQKPAGTLSLVNENLNVGGTFTVAQNSFDAGGRNVNAANIVVQAAGQFTGNTGQLTVSHSLIVQSGGTFSGPSAFNYPAAFQLSGTCQILPGAVFSATQPLVVIPPGLHLTSGVNIGNVLVGYQACLTLSADCIVSGISVTSGAFLNLHGNTLYDSGYFSNQGQASVGNGTLNLDGTHQQLDGTSQFQNLVKQSAGPDTLCFTQNSQQSVTGDLDLQGLSQGIPLRLRSSTNGQAYQLWAAPVATVQVQNLDVEDSNANAGQALV
ncbi:MAG TPA: hypothetical protein VNZ67_04440, partial [bacterium]|nr:hypothetical protein [bacterium]